MQLLLLLMIWLTAENIVVFGENVANESVSCFP